MSRTPHKWKNTMITSGRCGLKRRERSACVDWLATRNLPFAEGVGREVADEKICWYSAYLWEGILINRYGRGLVVVDDSPRGLSWAQSGVKLDGMKKSTLRKL